MRRRNTLILTGVAVLAVLALVAVLIQEFQAPVLGHKGRADSPLGLSLGLDLRGGTHLVYEADLSQISPEENPEEAIQGALDTIERRVNAFGVSEPVIQRQGENRISVQLPGVRNIEQAVSLIGSMAQLDFREILYDAEGNPASAEQALYLRGLGLSGEQRAELAQALQAKFTAFQGIATFGSDNNLTALLFNEQVAEEELVGGLEALGYGLAEIDLLSEVEGLFWAPAIAKTSGGEEVQLTGEYFKRNSHVVFGSQTSVPEVAFELKDEGPTLFQQITSRLLYKPLGIFLDNELVSWPRVQAVLTNSGVITGLDLNSARILAIQLNEGALPVPLIGPVVREDVDPTLGADSIRKSLLAAEVGLGLLLLFMVLYYRLPGVLASLALVIYGILMLATFKLIPVTLTLAGIAAFILSLGMAVDANVLIFERLKEELRRGRTLGAAIEAGFNRAWPAIRDSNVTTLIICLILWLLGNSFGETRVMGFALTLAIGVALSMFSAILVTRSFLRSLVGTGLATKLSLFTLLLKEKE